MSESIIPGIHLSTERPTELDIGFKLFRNRRRVIATSLGVVLVGVGVTDHIKQDHRLQTAHQTTAAQMAKLTESQADLKVTHGQLAEKQRQLRHSQSLTAAASNITAEQASGVRLQAIDALPGAGLAVAYNYEALMKAVTVKILKRPKGLNGSSGAYQGDCTGFNLNYGGQKFVATAAHCITRFKGGDSGPSVAAINTTETDPYEYAIETPLSYQSGRGMVAPVVAESISLTTDIALLKVDSISPASRMYAALTAIDFNTHTQLPPPPIGSAVREFSLPTASKGRLVEGDGVFLGIAQKSADDHHINYIVGLKNSGNPAEDACNYGASGSGAITVNSLLLGPLSMRGNLSDLRSDNNLANDGRLNVLDRIELESTLHVDMTPFNTVCGYSLITDDVVPQLAAAITS